MEQQTRRVDYISGMVDQFNDRKKFKVQELYDVFGATAITRVDCGLVFSVPFKIGPEGVQEIYGPNECFVDIDEFFKKFAFCADDKTGKTPEGMQINAREYKTFKADIFKAWKRYKADHYKLQPRTEFGYFKEGYLQAILDIKRGEVTI